MFCCFVNPEPRLLQKTVAILSKSVTIEDIYDYQRGGFGMEKEKFYLTTAIAYTSRKPHIGTPTMWCWPI